jgi:hypothetical protein
MKALLWMVPAVGVALGVGCSSNDDSATGCVGLVACCASLSGEEAELCQKQVTASGASETACQEELTGLENSGICAGGGGGEAGTGCGALSACCSSLPVDQDPTECMEVAGNGTDEACSESLSDYGKLGYCGSTGSSSTIPFGSADSGVIGTGNNPFGSDGGCPADAQQFDGSCCVTDDSGTVCVTTK